MEVEKMRTGNEIKPKPYTLNFLDEDIKVGLLKNKRVGMIRRTVRIRGGVVFDELIYLPQFKGFVVLRFGGLE